MMGGRWPRRFRKARRDGGRPAGWFPLTPIVTPPKGQPACRSYNQGEVMITGETVALTELRRGDSPTLLGWINDPETVRFNAPYAPIHESRHEAWFDAIAADPSRVVF